MAKVPTNPSVDDIARSIRDLRREVDRISSGGLIIRQNLDMRNFRIVNLAQDVAKTDAVSADTTSAAGGNGNGIDDHGELYGLADDDHPQYLNTTRAGALYQPLDSELTDLAGLSYSGNSLKVVRVNAGETAWELATVSGGDSGVITGGVLSINGGDNTKFDISAGTGRIVDYWTTPGSPVEYEVTLGSTAVAVTNIATQTVTFVAVDSAGTVQQFANKLTPQQRRSHIFIGQLGHANKTTIATAVPFPDIAASTHHQLLDLASFLGTINDGVSVTANGATLELARSSGTLYRPGANYAVDDEAPSQVAISTSTPLAFRLRTQTGAGATGATTLDVGNYDLSGTITSIVGVKWQNFRVYQLTSGNTVIQYGQTTYSTSNAAFDGITSESFVLLANLVDAVLIGIISAKSNATDLTDETQAIFYSVGRFGTVGGAGGVAAANLAELVQYDNTDSGLTATNVQEAIDELDTNLISAHTGLTALDWPSSGHTGTAGAIAGFTGGVASEFTTSGTGTELALTASPTLTSPVLDSPESYSPGFSPILRFRGSDGVTVTNLTPNADPTTARILYFPGNVDGTLALTSDVVTAHTGLTDLEWTSSGHTGTALRVAGFSGAGAASEFTTDGTGTVLALTESPTFTGAPEIAAATGTSLDLSGHAAIGEDATVTAAAVLNIDERQTIAATTVSGIDLTMGQIANSGSPQTVRGIAADASVTGTVVATEVTGLRISGAGQNATSVYGVLCYGATSSSSPTISNLYGGWFETRAGNSSTISNLYGLYIQPETLSLNSTITNNIGLHVAAPGVGTNQWAIQSAGGQSYHVGNLRIGSTTAPTAALDVTGSGKISASLDVVTDITMNGTASDGTGGLARLVSPAFTTPNIGAATGTSLVTTAGVEIGSSQRLRLSPSGWNTYETSLIHATAFGATDYLYLQADNLSPALANTLDLGKTTRGWKSLILSGSTSTYANVVAPAVANSSTHTLPNVTSTLVGRVAAAIGTAQSAAVGATTLFTPTADGFFRVSFNGKITQAATTSSTFGTVTVGYTDARDSTAFSSSIAMLGSGASVWFTSSAANITALKGYGQMLIYAKSGVAITFAIGYASSGATPMQYAYNITLEKL